MISKRRTLIIDGCNALMLFFVTVIFSVANIPSVAIIIAALITLPLTFRRTHTVKSSAFIATIFILQAIFGIPVMAANMTVIVVVHALASYGPTWARRSGLMLAYAGSCILLFSSAGLGANLMLWMLAVAIITSAWLLGKTQRSRRDLVKELTQHAHRLENEQKQERALAAAEERSRIAREMHDIVAHSLSVIITQADGASYAAKADPQIALSTLGTISSTARESLQEMRRLLGVLRHDEVAELGPAPTLSSLASLVAEVRAVGVNVKFDERTAEGARHKLPKGAELAAYRVVQEAITNIIKHAGPNVECQVTLEWETKGLVIAVIDNGRGAAATPTPTGSGQGIRGMQERIALYGGTVVAQPKIGGGFAVHAWIPYDED